VGLAGGGTSPAWNRPRPALAGLVPAARRSKLGLALRPPIKTLSTILIVAGVGLTLFPLLWIAYTALHIGPTQASALADWERGGVAGATPGVGAVRAVPTPAQALVLTVPRLKLTRYVPEGASVEQLRRFGVGRISWTAWPDGPGVVGIAGHRTTYGAPFLRLGTLERGDHIFITYKGKRFDYTVTDRRIVRPAEVEVLRAVPGERSVALITCAPLYSAKNRLVVLARLNAVTALSLVP